MEGLISKMKGIRKDPNRVLFPKSGNSLPSSLGSHSASGGVAASPLLNKRFTLPFLAVLAALAVGLLFLLPGGLLQAQQNNMTMVSHAENDEGAVATFTATDPEGATPIAWSLATTAQVSADTDLEDADNADAEHFTIDSEDGMLKFTSPPDFENPSGEGAASNTYKVVVVACDVALVSNACPASPVGQAGYHKVTVMVTNVDEDGKVTWTTNADADDTVDNPKLMQFDVGTRLVASVEDGDIAGDDKTVVTDDHDDVAVDPTWRWYRSSSKTSMGTMIDGATMPTYDVTAADVGMYLRATAYYVVKGNVDQETASLTSDYPVLADRIGDNKLKFDPAAVSREVREGKKGMKVGAPVTATGNHGAVNYTLGNAAVGHDNGKFKIDQKTGQITTDVDLDYDETDTSADDQCKTRNECKVTVQATDASGDMTDTGRSGANVFDSATVTIKITDVNEKPEFPTEAMTRIEVAENMTALAADADVTYADVTYTATDPEGRSLTYRLMGTDGAKFELNVSQVLSFKMKPDYEKPADANKDNVYEVTVRASDGRMYADRMVKVTVSGMDEGPMIMGKDSVNFAENGKDAVATFTATDPEGITPITWSLPTSAPSTLPDGFAAGDFTDNDAAHFTIDKDGMLKFTIGDDDDPPDFEAPRGTGPVSGNNTNTYKVVVAASDRETGEMMGYKKVTVMVTNVAEKGKVAWTVDADGDNTHTAGTPKLMQFQVGASLMASVSDGDIAGGTKTPTINLTWRWFRGSAPINGAETATYNVTAADVGSRIKVTATYNVVGTTRETASLTSGYPVLGVRAGDNKLKFDPAMVSREVAESKKGMKVGAPVTATGNHGAVNYTLVDSGDATTAAPKFKIDQKSGQITTNVDLDYDTEDANNCRDVDFCTVTVMATDASGDGTDATAPTINATVTIKVTDVNDKPTFVSENTAMSPMRITREEDNTTLFEDASIGGQAVDAPAVTYEATDPEGLNVNLTLMGPDGAKFQLSFIGVLSFKMKPDYEMPADANKDNVYMVTVRASDGTMYEDRMVEVTVTDVDEAPMIIWGGLGISGPSSVSYAEDRRNAVATYTVSGPGADMATWSLGGDDSRSFNISGGMLSFRSAPNFEMPRGQAMSDNNTNTYMVTVKASSGGSMAQHEVTVTVTNVEEMGKVTLWVGMDALTRPPQVGETITGAVMDPDGGVTGESWQWAKTTMPDMMDSWMDITGETEAAYMVMEGDTDYYLRVMATYTDVAGTDMATEYSMPTMMVGAKAAPMFPSETDTREVAENTAAGMNIGGPVMATDADSPTLEYTLGGADAASFDIGSATGQLMTKVALDYEMPRGTEKSDTNTNDYMVTVTATDPEGASDMITVTIMVTDVVNEEMTLFQRYDTNGNGKISQDEVIQAINDYLFGEGDEAITKDEAIEVINFYLFPLTGG